MEITTIKTSYGKDEEKRELEFDVEFPETLQEAIDTYGEAPVFGLFLKELRIDMQDFVRRHLKLGTADDAIIDDFQTNYVPDGKKPSVAGDPLKALMKKSENMSAEQKAALRNQLLAMLG